MGRDRLVPGAVISIGCGAIIGGHMADIVTTNLDSGSDSPRTARAQLLEAVQRLNLYAQYQGMLSIAAYPGVDATGATNTQTEFEAAVSAAVSAGRMPLCIGVFRLGNGPFTPARAVKLRGVGQTSSSDSGARARSVLLKDFNGVGVLLSNDDSGLIDLQVDSTAGKTGNNIQMTGSRTACVYVTSTNSGQCGFRVGSDGAANTNAFVLEHVSAYDNESHGIHVHDGSGVVDANAGLIVKPDLLRNGGDNLRIEQCMWVTIDGPLCQSATGYGIRIMGAARGVTVIGGDIEANGAGQGVLEAGTIGNVLYGAFYATSPVWVDNSGMPGQNCLMQYEAGIARLSDGLEVNLVNKAAGAQPALNYWADTGLRQCASAYAKQVGAQGEYGVKTYGSALATRMAISGDVLAYFNNLSLGVFFNKIANDTTTPGVNIEGGATGRIDIVNSGTGLTTAAAGYNGNGQVWTITTNGSTGAFNNVSDYRLKKNIKDADGKKALEAVLSWPVRKFEWAADGVKDIGFVAHELQAVKPDAVHGEKDAMERREVRNQDGSERCVEVNVLPQSVNLSKLIPELVAAVQYLWSDLMARGAK
jgi:hypothetical protein